MKGDPLTDILSLTSARCAEVGILVAGGPWALRFSRPQEIKFAAVLKGNCCLTCKDEPTPLQVKTGDVFVLPAERAYLLAGDLKRPAGRRAIRCCGGLRFLERIGDLEVGTTRRHCGEPHGMAVHNSLAA
jgi:hypothetical protein